LKQYYTLYNSHLDRLDGAVIPLPPELRSPFPVEGVPDGIRVFYRIYGEVDWPEKWHEATREQLVKALVNPRIAVNAQNAKRWGAVLRAEPQEIPNEYEREAILPWFKYQTPIGVIKVGMRHSVWEITSPVGSPAVEALANKRNSTVGEYGKLVHAWSLPEVNEYLALYTALYPFETSEDES